MLITIPKINNIINWVGVAITAIFVIIGLFYVFNEGFPGEACGNLSILVPIRIFIINILIKFYLFLYFSNKYQIWVWINFSLLIILIIILLIEFNSEESKSGSGETFPFLNTHPNKPYGSINI
jgi:hypothetical protein